MVEDGGQPRSGLEAGQWRDLDFDYIYLRYVLFKDKIRISWTSLEESQNLTEYRWEFVAAQLGQSAEHSW